MEEREITIPFDAESLQENIFHKLYRKLLVFVKKIVKRIVEIAISVIGIILLIPLSIVVFFQNLKNHDNGKIFYTQDRIGKNGKIFKIYKFRTMVNNASEILEAMLQDDEIKEEYETYRKLTNDPRLTKFGKVLRTTSLDEFPQFINVLKGEMSIVGPRAYLFREKEDMGEAYECIVKCKPGITGLWQVSGRSDVSFKNRLDMDIEYFEKHNLGLDMEILLKTVTTVLNKEGAA